MRLLTAEEVAERLGEKPAYVYHLARSGRLHSVRLGQYVRFRPDRLDVRPLERR